MPKSVKRTIIIKRQLTEVKLFTQSNRFSMLPWSVTAMRAWTSICFCTVPLPCSSHSIPFSPRGRESPGPVACPFGWGDLGCLVARREMYLPLHDCRAMGLAMQINKSPALQSKSRLLVRLRGLLIYLGWRFGWQWGWGEGSEATGLLIQALVLLGSALSSCHSHQRAPAGGDR